MMVSATFRYDVTEMKCQHKGEAQVLTFQLRDIIFVCRMNYRSVLLYDQLLKFGIFGDEKI